MKVKLLQGTTEPHKMVLLAARRCYSTKSIEELMLEVNNMSLDKKESLLNDLAKSGHLTPFEHCHYTFSIEGISRACSHQIIRHRLFSFDQLSNRYTTNAELVWPEFLCDLASANPELYNHAASLVGDCVCLYNRLVKDGIKPEDARMFLPHMTSTSLVMSGNGRVWIEMLNKRLCRRAQGEFRDVALKIFQQLHLVDPLVFNETTTGPSCLRLGYCTEVRSCGNPITSLLNEKISQDD